MYKKILTFSLLALVASGACAGFIDAREQEPAANRPGASAADLPSPASIAGAPASAGVSPAAPAIGGGQNAEILREAPQGGVPMAMKMRPIDHKPLVLLPGSRLSHSIRDWLGGRSIKLSWEAQGKTPGQIRDFEIESHWTSRGGELEASLTEVLSSFGLTAEILRAPGAPAGTAEMVMVRNGAAPRP